MVGMRCAFSSDNLLLCCATTLLWCIGALQLSGGPSRSLAFALMISSQRISRDASNDYYLNTAPESSVYCSAKPGAFSLGCPSQSCSSNYDCQIRDVRLRCVCDQELCGSVCVSLDAHCKYLDEVPNGVKRKGQTKLNENAPGQTVTYACNAGYSLIGTSAVTCQANLEWNVPPNRRGRCISEAKGSETCGPPKAPQHTILNPTPDPKRRYAAGDTFTYACSPGYTPGAPGLSATAVCSDGEWNLRDISCTPINCGNPGTPENGRHLNKNYSFDQKVSYFCNEGYRIECPDNAAGCQVRRCGANGKWSGTLPSCNPVRCPELRNPANGFTKSGRNTVNSVVEYFCNPGYRLNGPNKRLCRRDGTWDGSDPSCEIQDCGPPPFVPNAHRPVFTGGTTFGASAQYTCMEDTKFEGENGGRIVCQNSGQWLPAAPRCRKHCDAPTIPNARVLIGRAGGPEAKGKVPSDTTLLVQCREEFQLKRVYFPRCDNGSWTKIPECVPKDCNDRPPIVRNGIARFYSTQHNDRAEYTCYVGYELSAGSSAVTCRYGKWTGAPPVCSKKRCNWIQSEPGVAKWLMGPDGQKNPWTRKETLSDNEELVKFECTKKGHVLRGHTHAICLNGRWSPPGSPACVPQMHKRIPTDWLFYRRGRK